MPQGGACGNSPPATFVSQPAAQAVAGRLTGETLRSVPFIMTTWQEWKERFPASCVLANRRAPAVLSSLGKALHALLPSFGLSSQADPGSQTPLDELVLGVHFQGGVKAYPLDQLEQLAQHAATARLVFTDRLENSDIRIFFSPASAFAYAQNTAGQRLPSVVTYRATWFTFYPRSEVLSSVD